MINVRNFDPTTNFHADSGGGDPDAYSAKLRAYHQALWSKPLPTGQDLLLQDDDTYLQATVHERTFLLSSDRAVPSWSSWTRMAPLVEQIPADELREYDRILDHMGAMMLFPRNTIDGLPSINQAKGTTSRIDDRLDLTVECIRLHYAGLHDPAVNPLGDTLLRYHDFFTLFGDFNGYVDFFLLQDLVNDGKVQMLHPNTAFEDSPRPATVDGLREYWRAAVAFVQARNARMLAYAKSRGLAPIRCGPLPTTDKPW